MTDNQDNSIDTSFEQDEDFADLFEKSQKGNDFKTRPDSKVDGTIISVGEEWVFVDIGGKSEGSISKEELRGDDGKLTVKVGDPITAFVISARDGEVRLSIKMTSAAGDEALRTAHRSGIPVEGFVAEERKGGFSVNLLGKQAFCPYSQIDIQSAGPASDYIGKKFTFRIIEYAERGKNIVVSRKDILNEERAQKVADLKKSLNVGDTVEGVVQRVAKFGAFADIGGIEGLIPISELAWFRVNDPSDIVSPRDRLNLRIIDLDWDRNKVTLSLKKTQADPWDSAAEKFGQGMELHGRITRLTTFGAFVELEPGIEGMIHVSNFNTGRRIKHPKEVVNEGDEVLARVVSVDQDAHRIALEMVVAGQTAEDGGERIELVPGTIVSGTVDSTKTYGVFISLPGGKSGLLHVSEIGESKSQDLRNRFPIGASVEVQVLDIDPAAGKISLTIKGLERKGEQGSYSDFLKGSKAGSSMGTLGDILKSKLK
jgi:small subunit ribosomal protein S1